MDQHLLYFNGINGTTGDYLMPPVPIERFIQAIVRSASGQPVADQDEFHEAELAERRSRRENHLGVKEGVDETKLAETGWGVIFAEDDQQRPAIMEALTPLLRHRQSQAGARYAEFPDPFGRVGYQKGDDYLAFLGRRHVSTGPAEPDRVPYYLLIVGSPEQVPYEFQYMLDVQYAVGRIHFDSLAEYEQYALAVVASESASLDGGTPASPRRVVFFAPKNGGDPATEASVSSLAKPLAERLSAHEGWRIDMWAQGSATKDRLARLLGGEDTPSLLFTASHGMAYNSDDPHQRRWQGALLTSELTRRGEQWEKAEPDRHFFSADDVGDSADLRGLITFHFACYGAGTPSRNDFWFKPGRILIDTLAEENFMARLPQRMLGHPRAALAVIGHVERAWAHSFHWPGTAGQPQLAAYESTMRALMAGKPVGFAMEYFNERYAELSAVITSQLARIRGDAPYNPQQFAQQWTANHDARNFIVLGDPAVRLPPAPGDNASAPPVVQQAIDLSPPIDGAMPPAGHPEGLPEEQILSAPAPRAAILSAAIEHLEQAIVLLRSLAEDEN